MTVRDAVYRIGIHGYHSCPDQKNPPVRRVQGTGIFGDPNDLAMSLVMMLPFLISGVLARDHGVIGRIAAERQAPLTSVRGRSMVAAATSPSFTSGYTSNVALNSSDLSSPPSRFSICG